MRDKRGSHLALSLARLDALAERRPQRIGLSATVHPIEDAARFLVGRGPPVLHRRHRAPARPRPRDRGAGHGSRGRGDARAVERDLRPPRGARRRAPDDAGLRQHAPHGGARRAPPRRAPRRGARRRPPRQPRPRSDACGSSSASRRARCARSSRRRRSSSGSTSAPSTSSARSARRARSRRSCSASDDRATRSGGRRAGVSSRRRATSSSSAPRSSAPSPRAASIAIEPPVAPLDVLAQQIVAECAAREWSEDALFALVRQAAPYAQPRRDASSTRSSRAWPRAPRLDSDAAGALLHRDRIERRRSGGGARRASWRSRTAAPSPTSPTTASCSIRTRPSSARSTRTGRSRAWRATSSSSGSHSWRIRRVESRAGVVRVEDAHGQPPSIPFWLGEAPSRTWELSLEVSRLRSDVVAKLDERGARARHGSCAECALSAAGAAQVAAYVTAQRDALGIVPTMDDVVFERFFDEAGGMQLVVHAPFGGRVNRAFGLALRKRFCVSFDFELQAAATDDAIVLSMGTAHSFPLSDAFRFVRADQLDATLRAGDPRRADVRHALALERVARARGASLASAERRSRRSSSGCGPTTCSRRSSPRRSAARRTRPGRSRSPTIRSCARPSATASSRRWTPSACAGILERIERGEIRLHARDTTEPSPFSHEILNAKPYAFLDDAPLEERRTRAISLRRTLPEHQRDLGALDRRRHRAGRRRGAHPRRATPTSCTTSLLGLVAAPVGGRVGAAGSRSSRARARGGRREAPPGSSPSRRRTRGRSRCSIPAPRRVDAPAAPRRRRGPRATTRSSRSCGGTRRSRARSRSTRFASPAGTRRRGRSQSPRRGSRARGSCFAVASRRAASDEELCDRRLLARIHRHTLDRLRAEIEPVSAQDFFRYLFERHHLTARARAGGRAGLRDAIGMLQGFEIAAAAWEKDVLAPRVAGYQGEWLDELCLAGEVAWGRLSPRRTPVDRRGVDVARDADRALRAPGPRLAPRRRARSGRPSSRRCRTWRWRRWMGCAAGARSSSTTSRSPLVCRAKS